MNKYNNLPPANYFGIVSPCSTCSNQRSVPDVVLGLPACPRRAAAATQAEMKALGLSTPQIDPLALTGNEDSTSSNTSLVNPVYSTGLNSVLVWIATITDNPNLLDSSFDTNNINCKDKPVSPEDNEASYRAKGAWAEGDQLSIKLFGSQQTNGSSDDSVLVNGFASKVNFSYSSPRVPANRDFSVSGT